MSRTLAVGMVLAFFFLALAIPTEATSETSRRYVTGGSILGVHATCTPSLDFDIGAACNLPCGSDDTCEVTVVDDVRGSDVWFRVCVVGEELCRPHLYYAGFGARTINNASVIHVAPEAQDATTGIVTVS